MDNFINAIMTDTTCGLTCWYARDNVCRCSCGGRNHGALLDGFGNVPDRLCTIQGKRYRLREIGTYHEMHAAGRKVLARLGWAKIHDNIRYPDGHKYHYHYHVNDTGCPVMVKKASKGQLETWPELDFASEEDKRKGLYLLWTLSPFPDEVLYCEGHCVACEQLQLRNWLDE